MPDPIADPLFAVANSALIVVGSQVFDVHP
jgi:hypothetical protein